tara:strand:+ start:163 stop:486 length:324 start_codon:yes stop_codon:yes gene_type:complete
MAATITELFFSLFLLALFICAKYIRASLRSAQLTRLLLSWVVEANIETGKLMQFELSPRFAVAFGLQVIASFIFLFFFAIKVSETCVKKEECEATSERAKRASNSIH